MYLVLCDECQYRLSCSVQDMAQDRAKEHARSCSHLVQLWRLVTQYDYHMETP